jgi:MoaA/NifB/PqqE/SkfB family radical SAM enzyme
MNYSLIADTIRRKGLRYWLYRQGIGRVSKASLCNAALNSMEYRLGRSRLASNPEMLQIEPTTACNLGCSMCGRQSAWNELVKNVSYMSRETFLKITPFFNTARTISLQGWGESLLHPDFLWMVKTCKRAGAQVSFSTNGLPLNEKMATALVTAGADLIRVSIDAATAETYRNIRGGGFAKVLANLDLLARVKKRQGVRHPLIMFTYCVMKQNLQELPRLVELAQQYQVDEVHLDNLIVYQESLRDQTAFDCPQEVATIYERASALARRYGILFSYNGTEEHESNPTRAFRMFSVLSDGSAGCCGAQRVLVGNVHDAHPRAIWNGTEYQKLRRQYLSRELPVQCARCPNHTNAREDHVHPDMSYVQETLAARRWDLTDRPGRTTTHRGMNEPGQEGGEPRTRHRAALFPLQLLPTSPSAGDTASTASDGCRSSLTLKRLVHYSGLRKPDHQLLRAAKVKTLSPIISSRNPRVSIRASVFTFAVLSKLLRKKPTPEANKTLFPKKSNTSPRLILPRRRHHLRGILVEAERGGYRPMVLLLMAASSISSKAPEPSAAGSTAVRQDQKRYQQVIKPATPSRQACVPASAMRTACPAPLQQLHGESPAAMASRRACEQKSGRTRGLYGLGQ